MSHNATNFNTLLLSAMNHGFFTLYMWRLEKKRSKECARISPRDWLAHKWQKWNQAQTSRRRTQMQRKPKKVSTMWEWLESKKSSWRDLEQALLVNIGQKQHKPNLWWHRTDLWHREKTWNDTKHNCHCMEQTCNHVEWTCFQCRTHLKQRETECAYKLEDWVCKRCCLSSPTLQNVHISRPSFYFLVLVTFPC